MDGRLNAQRVTLLAAWSGATGNCGKSLVSGLITACADCKVTYG